MKKIYLVVLLQVMTGAIAFSQKPLKGCPKVIYKSTYLTDTACDPGIKNVRINFSNEVVVKYFNKIKKFIPEDSVWGIRPRNNNPLRYYNGEYYSLNRMSPVFKYSRRIGKYTEEYFSTSLDSPIYPYYQSQLKKHTDSATYAALVIDSKTNRHELSFDLFAVTTKDLNNQLWGGGLNVKYYPQKKWGTGLFLSGAGKETRDTFGFSIARPVLSVYEVGWLNSFDFIQKSGWRTGISLTNGIAIAELRDKAQKERKRTRYGYKDVPKRIITRCYYLLEPGVDLSIKLFSNNHNPDFYLTGSAKYRLQIGSSGFGAQNMSSAPLFFIGISMIGFDKEELR